ncbi:MAG: HgcAB-like fusion protein [Candidatus Thorarchaeota archaeon]|jgi:demethylmenaquinone methyltransferase/2-methoxy-6-polyprenyl-1,4-benzoquinol methylase
MMSYVYMKALESAPERYDKGINWLGWGKLDEIRVYIAELAEAEGGKVLDIGVGTGTQALMCAERGLSVIGIDLSPGMLSIARKKLEKKRSEGEESSQTASRVVLMQRSAVEVDEFSEESFGLVTSTLVFSELYESEQTYVLANAFRILKPGGALILADEVVPEGRLKRLAHAIISAPLKLLTYLVTQTSTTPTRNLVKRVEEAGFAIEEIENYQLDSFQLIRARKPENHISEIDSYSSFQSGLIGPPKGGVLSTIWQTAARMMGHPTEIGLIPVGAPTRDSPVLCTCNFNLTVRRLFKLLVKKDIDAWVLVAPTSGHNVWCASEAGEFNAGSVITAIRISNLEEHVNHHRIILPQLAASGVDPGRVKEGTGWNCVWGPVHMDDLPSFLENLPSSIRNKTEKQRAVRFDVKSRIEMATTVLLPTLLILLVPLLAVFAFLDSWVWALPIFAEIGLFYYGVFLFWPRIPARLGTRKVAIWTMLFMVLLFTGSWVVTGYLGIPIPADPWFQGLAAVLNWLPLEILVPLLAISLAYDADGSTPNQRSTLFTRAWNRGEINVRERWGAKLSTTQYGRITVDTESCTGCGKCVDVCPMLIPTIDTESMNVLLEDPDSCINCRACINRCPNESLSLIPETEAGWRALEKLQNEQVVA